MPSTLTTSPKHLDEPFEGLLASVLSEQQDLTAVERFAQWHDLTDSAPGHASASQIPVRAKHYSSLMPTTVPGVGQQYAFEVDLDACSGCKACVVACHNLNGLESEETWRKVGWLTSHDGALPIVQHVTTACHHCIDPGCLSGCPVKAYEKDPLTGIVRHLDDQCFGCKYCTMMCPYEVPQYSPSLGIVRKCDMCSQRIGSGEAPACVQACPNEAIRITLVQSEWDHELRATMTAALLPTAPPSHITLPTTKYLSSREQLTSNIVSNEALIDHPHEGHWPLVGMLVLTQASVGMWCVLSALLWSSPAPLNDYFWVATIAATLGVVGVHLALAHLGRPWLAFRAFLGWRTSWLSREAIAFGIYMAVASLTATGFLVQPLPLSTDTADHMHVDQRLPSLAFLPANGVAGPLLHSVAPQLSAGLLRVPMVSTVTSLIAPYTRWLVLLTAVIGLVAVACSAMIYVATHRSLWSGRRTGIEFAATTLGLGLALVALNDLGPSGTGILWLGAMVAGLGLVAKCYDRQQGRQATPSISVDWKNFSKRSGRLLNSELSMAWKAAWMSWLVAVILSSMLFLEQVPDAMFPFFIGTTIVLLAVSQLINRWLYFASIVTYRMPGVST